jgi:hypothetical protein
MTLDATEAQAGGTFTTGSEEVWYADYVVGDNTATNRESVGIQYRNANNTLIFDARANIQGQRSGPSNLGVYLTPGRTYDVTQEAGIVDGAVHLRRVL